MNFKGLPYKSIYFEYPDLEPASKKAGIPNNGYKADGRPHYTSPAIVDDSTGSAITDSYKIAEYLDKTYPTTPKAFPPGSEALQAAFYTQFNQLAGPILPLILPKIQRELLNPPSAEFYYHARSINFGKPLEQVEPVGEERVKAWANAKAVFDTVNGWLSKRTGPYFMGESPTFADFVVASMLQMIKITFGEDSEEWKDIATWNDGRWVTLLKDLDQYASVEN